jgi:hypothetical protein
LGAGHRSFRSQSENDIAARDVPGVHNHNAVIFETCREPMTLILKRARASRPSGQWSDDDYDVLADGKVVGRILEEGSRFGPPELPWGLVDHFDLAGDTGCDEWHRRDARRGDGEVSRQLDEGSRADMRWRS